MTGQGMTADSLKVADGPAGGGIVEIAPSVKVLGSRVHIIDLPDVIAQIDRWIAVSATRGDGRLVCRRIIVTGFHGLWEAHKHPDFKRILNSAELWVPDGIAPVWVAHRKGFRNASRVPGAELMKAYMELADRKGYSSFFYGDTDETLAQLRAKLQQQYPGHKVAGTFSPPFRPVTADEDAAIVRMINDARPDVLWVGLGLPKQDRWVYEHLDRLRVPIAIGVGAAFKFLAGTVKRVPAWIGNHGLEWLWRFIQEPTKLWRRDLLDGPRFVGHVLLEMAGLRKYD